jgi:hypothetical protein
LHILEACACRVGSSPTTGTNFISLFFNEMVRPEEGSASESASEINTGMPPLDHPGITRQSLAMTGFAARLVG